VETQEPLAAAAENADTGWSTRTRNGTTVHSSTEENTTLTVLSGVDKSNVPVIHSETDHLRLEIRRQATLVIDFVDKDFAAKVPLRRALRDRGEAAATVVTAEMQQMVKKVWHGVYVAGLTLAERRAIIPSTLFLKNKFTASRPDWSPGATNRTRAYTRTSATSSVFICAGIAAAEGRIVEMIDIGGAYLNARMRKNGVRVRMRLNQTLTEFLVAIDSSYAEFVEKDGSCVCVVLDRAQYGCVESAYLWHLKSKPLSDGFVENPYDQCVFNKLGADGNQVTIVLHVDDLMVSSASQSNLNSFGSFLKSVHPETKTTRGVRLDYIGMSFAFSTLGEVRVTMDNCTQDILAGCGVTTARATPAAACLFDTRDSAPPASEPDAKWFHTHVAKMLYLSKRVRPECLTAVSFLSTRVQVCDQDDLGKLRRLLGY
jgi:hypothetical protein